MPANYGRSALKSGHGAADAFAMNTVAHTSAMPAGGPQLDNRRVIAGLVDLLVVLAGALLIGLAAGLSGAEYREAGLPLSGVITAWALYYYFACESGGGQTLGKKLMKIRVVRVDGSPPGMPDIAVRTVLRLIDGLFVYLVGLIVMLATGGRRGRLGDLAAGTMIVSTDAAQVQEPEDRSAPEPPEMRPFKPSSAPAPVEAEPAQAEPELESEASPEAEDEEPQVVVNSMETVSAIDLVMEEEEPAEDWSSPASPQA
jgi:uncharacterized RDD family membrane protein YckC